jgi:ATP-dependent Zn protease
MDGFEAAEGVIVVAATNYAESLDDGITLLHPILTRP